MENPLRRISLTVLLLSATFLSCKDNITDEGSPSNVVFPASGVSYSAHVQVLFDQTCALSGCHDAGTHESPLKLNSHSNTVFGVPGIVVEGSPDQSILVLRIEGRVGQRMPVNLNPLNQNQINGIRAWIAAGAPNN